VSLAWSLGVLSIIGLIVAIEWLLWRKDRRR
jgi:hypothetical protein